MATSGLAIIQYTRNEIIAAAMRKLGVLEKGGTPDTEDYTNGTIVFNMLIAEFRGLGMPLWARNSYTFNPTAATLSYNVGTGQTLNTPYPLKLYQAYRTPSGSGTLIPLDIIGDYNFNMLPTNSTGAPIQVTYQPKINLGVLKVWPTPGTADIADTITLVYQRPFEYMSSSTDTMDFPEEWYNPVVFGLASRWAPEWGIPLMDRQHLNKEFAEILDRVLGMGGEDGSIFFAPDWRE